MKEKTEEIKRLIENRGYDPVDAPWGCYSFINGVKVEWNTVGKCLVVGYGNSENDLKELRALIKESFGNTFTGRAKTTVRFLKNPYISDFENLIDLIETLPFTLESPILPKRGAIKYSSDNFYIKMAKYTRAAVIDSNPGLLNRSTMGVDRVDSIITIGQSTGYRLEDGGWREHVVPCDYLFREGIEMVLAGKADWEIALMYQRHLLIVLISREEQKRLDSDLGLKVDMPEGWVIGDDPFARLKAAGIKLRN